MSSEEQHDPVADDNRFFVPSHTWFIAPLPRPADQATLIRGIRQMGIVLANGKEGTVIPMFSDLDLAETFANKLDDRDRFKPLSCDTRLGLATRTSAHK